MSFVWDNDEDLVYAAVLDWQNAGGKLERPRDDPYRARASSALWDMGYARWDEVMDAIGEGLEALKKSGNWDEYDDLLVRKKLVDLTIATTVSQMAAGQAPDTKGWVAILCKVASTPHGAKVGTAAAKKDAAATLEFFNTADAAELKKVAYIGDAVAAEIIAQREQGAFTAIDQVLEVKFVRDNLLTPAALEIRDEYMKLREAEKAAADAAPTGG